MKNKPLYDEDWDQYTKELEKLSTIKRYSSHRIEDMKYKLSTGGLALSIPVLSFCFDKNKEILEGHWGYPIAVWGAFSLCIILHYWSQYISVNKMSEFMRIICDKIKKGEPYNSNELSKLYNEKQKLLIFINHLTSIILLIAIVGFLYSSSLVLLK